MFHSLSVEQLRKQLHGAAGRSFISLDSPKQMQNDAIGEVGDGTKKSSLSLTFSLALTAKSLAHNFHATKVGRKGR
jgi:hypothetical protein